MTSVKEKAYRRKSEEEEEMAARRMHHASSVSQTEIAQKASEFMDEKSMKDKKDVFLTKKERAATESGAGPATNRSAVFSIAELEDDEGSDGGETHKPVYRRLKRKFKRFEDVMEYFGLFGRYQIFTCVVIQYASIMWAGNYSFMSLGRLEPDWICLDDENNTVVYEAPVLQNESICQFIRNCSNLTTRTNEFVSIVQSFHLVCDLAHIPDILLYIFLCARICGSIVGGHIGDSYGRKKGFFFFSFLIIITSVMSIASTGWKGFAVFQGLNGFSFGIIEVTSLTLMMESTDSKYRLIPNACFQWALGYMVLALITKLTLEWRMYLLFVNLVSAPLLVGYLLFLESPRWLIVKGRLIDACKVLVDIGSGRWNMKYTNIVPEDLKLIHTEDENSRRIYTFYHLFARKRLAIQSLLQLVSIFTYSLVNSTYIFNVDVIPGGPALHFFYFGLFRIWIPPLVVFLDWKFPKFGRKQLYLGSVTITGICFAINIALLALGYPATFWVIPVANIVGVIINTSAFYMSIIQITTAAYPTVIRCLAFGWFHCMDDVGAIVSTFFLYPYNKTNPLIIYLVPEVFIVLCFISAIFLQPETKGKPICDLYKDDLDTE